MGKRKRPRERTDTHRATRNKIFTDIVSLCKSYMFYVYFNNNDGVEMNKTETVCARSTLMICQFFVHNKFLLVVSTDETTLFLCRVFFQCSRYYCDAQKQFDISDILVSEHFKSIIYFVFYTDE